MNANFEPALLAAHAAAATQNYPTGALYMVASPIGNLADISLRALHVMQLCTVFACEDTRHTQTMVRAYGIEPASKQWLAAHQHNEAQVAQDLIARLQSGERVAYLSDAGTPAISDPGARLAWHVTQAGLRVIPLPGASSVTTLLSACGSPAPEDAGFVFVGFLPSKSHERTEAVTQLRAENRSQVLLEAPHRIEALATALQTLGERQVTVGRELTKQFEEIVTLPAQAISAWLASNPQHLKGEFALVIHAQASQSGPDLEGERVLRLLLGELPVKSAVKLAAEITGAARNSLYDLALQIKQAN
jgi:16S rRNA (cytidine1402-2'-O)-methyltransferase